jgi:hypothetical protein
MGLDYRDIRMFEEARRRGHSFENTLMVARLSLKLHPHELAELRASTPTAFATYKPGDYSDEVFTGLLGTKSLTVMDYSTYEGATLVQDLNQPVPSSLHGRFDAVVDGGSLEHVFNFPVAIASLMAMVKVGGLLYLRAPANNLCGHGFYQFSPELMFRIFSAENGFRLHRVTIVEYDYPSIELTPARGVYEVIDPSQVGERVGLVSKGPAILVVEAVKEAEKPLFGSAPMQSDYVDLWKTSSPRPSRAKGFVRAIFSRLPAGLKARLLGRRELGRFSLSNGRFYRKLEP